MVNDMASNDSDGKKSLSNPPKGGDYSKEILEILLDLAKTLYFDRLDNTPKFNEPGLGLQPYPPVNRATQSILDILDKAIKENGKQE